MSHFSYACKMRYPLNLPLIPCDASEMSRNTLNHCLKFPLCFISCHICYGKNSEKLFNTLIKVELFISKTSNI